MTSAATLAAMALACALMASSHSVAAADSTEATDVPILWSTPVCEYGKLGVVFAKVGSRVNEATQDDYMPTVKYVQAFKLLSDAAREKGANAVVFSHNQAVFYTYRGKKTHDPVYIHLRGGAIRLPQDTTGCKLDPVDPEVLTRRARAGKAINTPAHDVYGD